MTSLPFLGAQVLYGLLGLLSLVDYWRYRDRPRLAVALTFGSFAGFILTQNLLALGFEPPWLVSLNRLLLLAHPFLLVRLVDYVAPVPRPILRAALGGLVLFGLLDLLLPAALDGLTGLLILSYFIIFEGYVAGAAVLGARRLFSVPRRRLLLAAAGSGLLALVLIYLLLTPVLPALAAHSEWVVPLLLSLSALGHYLGFATPRWLRHTWQMNELYAYLRTVGGRPATERADHAIDELCRAGLRAGGGLMAAVALDEGGAGELTLHTPPDLPPLAGTIAADQGAIGRAWRERRLEVAGAPAGFGLPPGLLAALGGVHVMLAVPIASPDAAWGLLLVFRRGRSPFVADDFRLLSLLAEQTAHTLDFAELIDQLRHSAAQLEASNKELEAFAYSVSHDLRAPLRAIDGFSQALLEDFGPNLPPDGHAHLERIRSAAQRMASLIDDLLDLARVARAEMALEPVDLSALAQSVAAELSRVEPTRQVSFVIAPGLNTTGDARLLRLVLENLLGNAWKFTRQRPAAVIEFGARPASGPPTFFVRDNGAGFDMTFASRLFTAFQRLHTAVDFPGSGVGLATVQRILDRHRGRIWAEAAVGDGATFFFELDLD